MKIIIFVALLFCSLGSFSQKPVEIQLWPENKPNSNGVTGKELELEKNRVSNVTSPTLTVYPADKPNGKAIIMCPGGGYSRLAMDHEGHDMATWFNSQGITYAVLKYRLPNGHHEVLLTDAEQAMRIMRSRAKEWKVNPHQVGIMGASAGGHLASTLATHWSSEETRPDFQILLYPVISMKKDKTHNGSRTNLLGKEPNDELVELYSNELQVKPNTPKAFITLSSDDKTVIPQNSVDYYLALQSNNIPAELHIYPSGAHGWGFRDNFIYKRDWTRELERWLRE